MRPSGVLDGDTGALVGALSSLSSLSDSLGSFGSCKNRISVGSTETISPGAKRVLASECCSDTIYQRGTWDRDMANTFLPLSKTCP